MSVQMNQVMQRHLEKVGDLELPVALQSDPQVAALFNATPLQTDDGTLVMPWTPNWAALRRQFPTDLAGYECLINHVHLDRVIGPVPDAPRLRLKLALAIAEHLGATLHATGPVTVIVSFDGEDASVRVHRTRPGKAWLADDLEGYAEGVLVINGDDAEAIEYDFGATLIRHHDEGGRPPSYHRPVVGFISVDNGCCSPLPQGILVRQGAATISLPLPL